jgi:hypothetical protein
VRHVTFARVVLLVILAINVWYVLRLDRRSAADQAAFRQYLAHAHAEIAWDSTTHAQSLRAIDSTRRHVDSAMYYLHH